MPKNSTETREKLLQQLVKELTVFELRYLANITYDEIDSRIMNGDPIREKAA